MTVARRQCMNPHVLLEMADESSWAVKKVLHVGCGRAPKEKMPSGFHQGWEEIRFDINPDVKPDIIGTITDMEAVADESVDAIYSSHNIEHVYSHQVSAVLSEFRRVLVPDGFAIITCPDIESVAKHVAQGRLTDPLYMSSMGPISALDVIFGHTNSIAHGWEYMAHRTAFTAKTLMSVLRAADFGSVMIMQRESVFDLWALVTKGPLSQDDARRLRQDYFPPPTG